MALILRLCFSLNNACNYSLLIRIRRLATLGDPVRPMALITIANLILLLGLAGSTDAFAKPRARVARGGASSSKARDAVLLNWLLANSSLSADGSRKLDIRPGRYPGRPGGDLPRTKPKPLAVELAVDVGIVRYARRLPASSVVVQDISFKEDRMRKSLFKIAVVLGLHLKFDLMPPLIVFSLVHWVAQPLWWDKETSYYRKYGLGRNGGPRAFGVARNIWIYTKEFMMPKKL